MEDPVYLVLLELNKDLEIPKSPSNIAALCQVCIKELELNGISCGDVIGIKDSPSLVFCQTCQKFISSNEFGFKKNGMLLKTCKKCSERKMRYYYSKKAVRRNRLVKTHP